MSALGLVKDFYMLVVLTDIRCGILADSRH